MSYIQKVKCIFFSKININKPNAGRIRDKDISFSLILLLFIY